MSALVQPAQVDPRDLTTAQRKALVTIHDHTPGRSNGGFGRVPDSFVGLTLARGMMAAGLARMDYSARGVRMMLTGAGLNTYSVMLARKARRS